MKGRQQYPRTKIVFPMVKLSSDLSLHKVFNYVMCYPQHCTWQPLLCEQIQITKSFVCCLRLNLSDAEFSCCHEKTENSKKIFWPSQQKTTFETWVLTLNACVLLGKSQSLPSRCSDCQLSIYLIDVCLQTSKRRSGEA